MTTQTNKHDFKAEFKRRALVLIYGEHCLEAYSETEYTAIYDAITSTGKSVYQGKAVPLPNDFVDSPEDAAPMLLSEAYAALKAAVESVLSQHYIVTAQISDDDACATVLVANDANEASESWKGSVEYLLEDGEETYINSSECLKDSLHLHLD
jgi:hypothetical protein